MTKNRLDFGGDPGPEIKRLSGRLCCRSPSSYSCKIDAVHCLIRLQVAIVLNNEQRQDSDNQKQLNIATSSTRLH